MNKIKVQLKLSISRLRMVQQKDVAVAKQQRRAMASLLEQGKEESARIRVENIIRSDITTELLEVLELYCELLLARIGLLEAKDCDPGLEEAIKSIIYAAPRLEIKELAIVRQLLGEKYGKEFVQATGENADGKVAKRVFEKLRVEPPPSELVDAYLGAIADTYDIEWPKRVKTKSSAVEEVNLEAGHDDDDNDNDDDDDRPSTGDEELPERSLSKEELARATPPRTMGPPTPVKVMPRSPTTEDVRPELKLPGSTESKAGDKMQKPSTTGKTRQTPGPGGRIPDVDELSKRFAQLKR